MALQPDDDSGLLLRRAPGTLTVGAVAAAGIAAARPAPIILVGALAAVLAMTWLTLAARAVRAGGQLGDGRGH